MTTSFVYSAIGDSLTFGTGAPDYRGFTFRIEEVLKQCHPSFRSYNFGVVGATTKETLHRLRTDEEIRRRIASADLITVTSGGNDLIQAAKKVYFEGALRSMKQPMRKFALAYEALIAELVRLNRTIQRGSTIVVTDCYNPFPRVRDAVLWIQYVNRVIRRVADRYDGRVVVAKTHDAFAGNIDFLMSDDGVHPNRAGYRVMADAVMEAILQVEVLKC